MPIHLLTPLAALIAVLGILPLALALAVERRNARSRTLLDLPETSRRSRWTLPVAIGLLVAVLGLAASRPVLSHSRPHLARLDAEALVAVDISRSMKASPSAHSPSRLDRARRIALEIRAALPEVPTGIGTFTDRPLPVVLPTPDRAAFTAAVTRSLAIEQPPGLQTAATISSFDAVAPFPLEGYFAPSAKKRLLVILTDAESTGFNEVGVRKSFETKPRTAVVLIRIGKAGERVFGAEGRPESAYIPPPATGDILGRFLDATHGRGFDEAHVPGAERAARQALGSGPTVNLGSASARHDLAPWLVLAAVVPLGVVLRRRNF
jgi:hypothetical protein